MKQLIFTLLLSVFALSAAIAQPYAHVNFGNLLSLMPDVKGAEAGLQAYEKEQTAIGQKMVADFQAEYARAETNAPDLTPNQLKALQEQFQQKQAAIKQFEQQMSVNIEKKRQELLGPIIQKAKDAVAAEAEAKGFQMVFDSSIFGSVLFADDMTDLLPGVKGRLGIQ